MIDWRKLGWAVEVSLRFTLDKTNPRAFDEFLEAARAVPEVIEIQTFLGRVDLRLNVIARDMSHYQEIYRARILTLPHIAEIDALMLVSTIKERCRVCYTCVRECPAKAIRIVERQAEVIPERCIGCGNCVRVCSQHAKRVASDEQIVECENCGRILYI